MVNSTEHDSLTALKTLLLLIIIIGFLINMQVQGIFHISGPPTGSWLAANRADLTFDVYSSELVCELCEQRVKSYFNFGALDLIFKITTGLKCSLCMLSVFFGTQSSEPVVDFHQTCIY